jgi:DNA sulfur modification protein DndE
MSATMAEYTRGYFRTSRYADELNGRFQAFLGLPHRYGPARLALGRSLRIPEIPMLELGSMGFGKPIKGEQLFGQGIELATWITLLSEHDTRSGVEMTPKRMQSLVASHWQRGMAMLWEDWRASAGDFDAFVSRLVAMTRS